MSADVLVSRVALVEAGWLGDSHCSSCGRALVAYRRFDGYSSMNGAPRYRYRLRCVAGHDVSGGLIPPPPRRYRAKDPGPIKTREVSGGER